MTKCFIWEQIFLCLGKILSYFYRLLRTHLLSTKCWKCFHLSFFPPVPCFLLQQTPIEYSMRRAQLSCVPDSLRCCGHLLHPHPECFSGSALLRVPKHIKLSRLCASARAISVYTADPVALVWLLRLLEDVRLQYAEKNIWGSGALFQRLWKRQTQRVGPEPRNMHSNL